MMTEFFFLGELYKAEFSAVLLQSSVSHDPLEIILICWVGAQDTFLIGVDVENTRAHVCVYVL